MLQICDKVTGKWLFRSFTGAQENFLQASVELRKICPLKQKRPRRAVCLFDLVLIRLALPLDVKLYTSIGLSNLGHCSIVLSIASPIASTVQGASIASFSAST